MRDLVEYLAKSLAADPTTIRVEQQGSTYTIFVPQGSEGQLIGKGGRVIQSIRTIVRASSAFNAKHGGDRLTHGGDRLNIQVQAEATVPQDE